MLPVTLRRRRRLWLLWLAMGIALASVAIVAIAWLTSPSVDDFDRRVQDQIRSVGARPVALSEVAPSLREAVVAIEDERFYRHHGIDTLGLLRAATYDASHFSFAQGGSTITEQLAKELYLDGNDDSAWRKLQDSIVAFRSEDGRTKEVILAAYLNVVYFGEGAYGVADASERYFGVPPSDLTLAQASLLAGLIRAPVAYDPLLHPDVARDRQIQVLRSMVRNHFITAEEGGAVLSRPLSILSGAALRSRPGVDLRPGPSVFGAMFAGGLGLLAMAVAVFALSRRPRWRPALRCLAALLGAAGLLLLARAFPVV